MYSKVKEMSLLCGAIARLHIPKGGSRGHKFGTGFLVNLKKQLRKFKLPSDAKTWFVITCCHVLPDVMTTFKKDMEIQFRQKPTPLLLKPHKDAFFFSYKALDFAII